MVWSSLLPALRAFFFIKPRGITNKKAPFHDGKGTLQPHRPLGNPLVNISPENPFLSGWGKEHKIWLREILLDVYFKAQIELF